MALSFLGVVIVFTTLSFEFQEVKTSSQMMSGPNSPNLSPLNYQVWGKYWSLNKSCNRSQNQFPSFKMQLIWSALPENAVDNAVKDYHKRQQVCV